jgi:hypothetical protein
MKRWKPKLTSTTIPLISLLCCFRIDPRFPRSALGRRSKRAEQNRKAQQAFRKRREEKMKELEEKAREMERLHSAIDGGLRRVREVELVSRPLSAI